MTCVGFLVDIKDLPEVNIHLSCEFPGPNYRKVPKFLDADYLYCKHSKIQTKRFYHGVIPLNDANGIANSEDPDQTAPLGAV